MAIKQVIVMRKDLKMRRGKEVAQGAHASLKIFFDRMSPLIIYEEREQDDPHYEYGSIKERVHGHFDCRMTPEMESWKEGAFTKICVKVNSEEELLEIVEKAKLAKLPVALICDKGLTEFDGVPTNTCCAIGPANSEEIDKITSELSLY